MTKFIELHTNNKGEVELINVESIERIEPSGNQTSIKFINQMSSVYYDDDYETVRAKILKGESPKEI
ncbi:MAG: hypothetical protein ACI4MQ_06710 [Candidatus Coproplasma sp.]